MHVVPVRRRTHLVAEPGGEVGCICERCFLEVEGRGVDLGWGGSALVRPRRRLTHQDHPEIVGDLLSLRIVDQEMGGQALVEVGGDALVGEGVGECLVVVRPLLRCHRGVEKIGD